MTRYTADINAFNQDSNRNLVPAADFVPTIYIIHDRNRLGEDIPKDYRVTVPWPSYGIYLSTKSYIRLFRSQILESYF